jgi:hypothetical protein
MRIDETPDHAIQEAVEDFRKRLGSAPQKETSIACSENGSQRRAEAVDPEKAFREKWLSLSWEEIGGLLFERELDLGLEEEAYYMYAFGGLPFRKMVAKLAEMVTGQRSVDIHWPLVGQVLTSLFSKRARGADKEAIANKRAQRPVIDMSAVKGGLSQILKSGFRKSPFRMRGKDLVAQRDLPLKRVALFLLVAAKADIGKGHAHF